MEQQQQGIGSRKREGALELMRTQKKRQRAEQEKRRAELDKRRAEYAEEEKRMAEEEKRSSEEDSIIALCEGEGDALAVVAATILSGSSLKPPSDLLKYTPEQLASEYSIVSQEEASKFLDIVKKVYAYTESRFGSEVNLARHCFRIPFEGSAHKELHSQLVRHFDNMEPSSHYSPYCALVQSSGVGKSRAVMQLSELGVYICYCSLASVSTTAFPPRTGGLAHMLLNTFTEYGMVLYLNAWLQVLATSISTMSPKIWMQQQLDGGLAGRVLAQWKESDKCVEGDPYKGNNPDIWNNDYSSEIIKTVKNALREHRPENHPTCHVIFAFDEAKGLLVPDPSGRLVGSPFYQVRRALRIFFGHCTFGAVVLDTSAKVMNLLPRQQNESSERASLMGYRLAHPIYFLPNMSLFKTIAKLDNHTDCLEPKHWLKQGRPLWSARLKKADLPSHVCEFALQKLVHTVFGYIEEEGVRKTVDVHDGEMIESQAMALLSATAGLCICARSELAEAMSASHMSLILRVSTDRSKIYIGLPAEPILAEGAARALRKSVVQKGALEHLLAACKEGYVTLGPRGEFVAKFILVAATWDTAEEWQLRKVPLKGYLQMLLVSGHDDQSTVDIVKAKCPEEASVFFNSFVLVRKPPTTSTLYRAFTSGYALMYRAGNSLPGVDIIIPVYTPEGMTCIVVSVKNLQISGWLEEASIDKVRSEFTNVQVDEGLIRITVVMSLREPNMKDRTNVLLWTSNKGDVAADTDPYINLTCYGIDQNYSFLTKEVKELLKEVLITVPDELAGATDEEKLWIRQLLLEQYLGEDL